LSKETTPVSEFIRVFCTVTSWPFIMDTVYREFHAIPLLARESSKEKLKKWTNKNESNRPPNIVMIGIDSISRMNFHRSFNETLLELQKLDSVELLGYTKGSLN